jgi:UDPglucose--hexose-1-phosphate uridylyltransferase
MPLVPTSVAEELLAAENFYRANHRCIYCQLLADELSLGQRIVFESPGFVAFCPYAPRFPFETWIVPRAHASHFETLAEGGAAELALVLRTVVAKIEVALARPAYNYIIHTGSFDTFGVEHYHWHIEIIPRVTKTAGFEWGTGFFINPMPPEEAAGVLRACDTMS